MSTSPVVPVRPRLGLRAWALLIPAGLVVLLVLVGILVTLLSVRTQLTQQNQRTRLLIQKADPSLKRAPGVLDTAAPVLRDAAPVLKDALPVLKASRAAIPRARRTTRDAQQLLTATRPVVADLGSVVAVLPPLIDQLTPVARDLAPVAAQLRAANLPPLLRSVQQLADAGTHALPQLADFATEVRRRELLRRASHALTLVGRIAALQQTAVDATRQTLGSTKHIESMFAESLQIQRETLAHTASIDRKFGGTAASAIVP